MANWTQEELDELNKAIALGASSYKFEGKEVVLRSLAEMLEVQGLIKTELDPTSSAARRGAVHYPVMGQGL